MPDPTPLQYDFIEYLNDGLAWNQITAEYKASLLSGCDLAGARKILFAFRGAAKTYVCTTNSVYRLRLNPLEEVLVVSATHDYAGAIASMAYNMITKFEWLAPDLAPTADQRQSALAFDVRGARTASKDPSFSAEGIFGQLTGKRATIVIGDDLEVPNTSDTEVNRAKLRHRVSELGGAIIKPGGDIFLLGTPQNEQTIYKEYADDKGYELRMYPIIYPRLGNSGGGADDASKYGTRLAPLLTQALETNPLLAGTSTEPARFTERDILARKNEWGNTEFDRQFRLFMDAGAGHEHPLKLKDLIVMDLSPPLTGQQPRVMLPAEILRSTLYEHRVRGLSLDSLPGDGSVYFPMKVDIMLPAEETICWVDPSGEGKDETTWTIMAGQGGRVFFLAQGASRDGSSAPVLEAIAKDCKRWGVQIVKVESNFGQGMFSSLLRPYLIAAGCECAIEDIRIGKVQKEVRIIQTLEPMLTAHRLVVNREVLERDYPVMYENVEEAKRRFYRLTYQLTRMTKKRGVLKHDDRVDGLAGAAAHFVDRMKRTLSEAESLGHDRWLEQQLELLKEAMRKNGQPILGEERDREAAPFGREIGRRLVDPTTHNLPSTHRKHTQ